METTPSKMCFCMPLHIGIGVCTMIETVTVIAVALGNAAFLVTRADSEQIHDPADLVSDEGLVTQLATEIIPWVGSAITLVATCLNIVTTVILVRALTQGQARRLTVWTKLNIVLITLWALSYTCFSILFVVHRPHNVSGATAAFLLLVGGTVVFGAFGYYVWSVVRYRKIIETQCEQRHGHV